MITVDPDRIRHDLSNHLGVILGLADILLDECSHDEPRWQDLQEIRSAARAALNLLKGAVSEPDPMS